jgi:hypothetical protein
MAETGNRKATRYVAARYGISIAFSLALAFNKEIYDN